MKDAPTANAGTETDPKARAPSCRAPGSACPLCEAAMYGVHCKQICPNCGYKEDCSDLFRV